MARFSGRLAIDRLALLRHLAAGGVIAYPTESCYGLGCDPRNAQGVARILAIKGRPRQKGLIVVGSRFGQFNRYLEPVAETVTARFDSWWPGPVTLLLPASQRCPHGLTGRHSKLAVRVTAHPETASLCDQLDMALVSTSANRAGRVALRTAARCRREFGEVVWVLDGHIGTRRRPSTILDPTSDGVIRR